MAVLPFGAKFSFHLFVAIELRFLGVAFFFGVCGVFGVRLQTRV